MILGKLALAGWFRMHEFNLINNRLTWIFNHGITSYIEVLVQRIQFLIFSLFNVLWLPIIYGVYRFYSLHSRDFNVFGIATFLSFCIMCLAWDSTRVFILIFWNVLLIFFLFLQDLYGSEKNQFRRVIAGTVLFIFLIPPLISWEGKMHSTTIVYTVEALVKHLTGVEPMQPETQWAIRPFYQGH